MKKALLLLICTLAATSALAAEGVDALVDKVAKAYGGREALENITAVRETGRVEAATQMGNSGPIVRTYARPLKLRVEIGEASKPTEVRVLDGEKGWRNGQESSSGMGYEAMVLQAVRLDLPFQFLSQRKVLVEKESMDYQGKRLQVVELPLERGLSVRAGVEPITGRILFSTGTTKGGPSGPMTFETRYEDFRTVEGRLFAFKEINFAGGSKTAETVLSKIELLKAAPSGAFRP
jgi:hypothetical protein